MPYTEITEDHFVMTLDGVENQPTKKISNGTEVFITPHIKITAGAGAGKVLTSDENGNTSWEAAGEVGIGDELAIAYSIAL